MINTSNLLKKIKLIFLPFILIQIGFIAIYSFLHWAIFIRTNYPIKEEYINLWIPIVLIIVSVLIWFRPRMKLLQFKKENGSFGVQVIAIIAIFLPTLFMQEYLQTATGKLTTIDTIYQIEKKENSKFYSIKNYYIDKEHIAVQSTLTTSGKHGEHIDMCIYIAMPILLDRQDASKTTFKYWLGKKYKKQISSNISDEEREKAFKHFSEETQREFDATDFNYYEYFEVIGFTDEREEFSIAIQKWKPTTNYILFEAHNEYFKDRNGSNLQLGLGFLGIGMLLLFIILLYSDFNLQALSDYEQGLKNKDEGLNELLDVIKPRDGFYITPILIFINIICYLILVFSGFGIISFKADVLLKYGANYHPAIANGEWWRLVSNIFMHGGLLHLVANMYGLLFIGVFLEPILGRKKYLFLYISSGILASIASFCWYDATVSVGASGAIFGLYGFFAAILLLKIFPVEFDKGFSSSIFIFIVINLSMGIAGGIDNAAHIGGLASGFILGLLLARNLKNKFHEDRMNEAESDDDYRND